MTTRRTLPTLALGALLLAAPCAHAQSMDDVEAALGAGDVDGALGAFDAIASPSASAYRSFAGALFRAGEFDAALVVVEDAVAAFPDEPRFVYLLGFVHQRAGRCTEARDAYERFLARVPDDAAGWRGRAECAERTGQTSEARASWEQVLQHADDADDRAAAEAALATLDGADTATPAAPTQAAPSAPPAPAPEMTASAAPPAPAPLVHPDASAALAAGTAAADAGDWPAAVLAFAEATRHDPASVDAWYRLGVARAIAGDAAGARDALRRVADLAPSFPDIDALVAAATARAEYDASIALDRPGYFSDAGVRAAARADAFDAGRWLLGVRAELTLDPLVAPASACDRALLEGRIDDAVAFALQAIAASPASPPAWWLAADAHRLAGRYDEARYFIDLYEELGGDAARASALRASLDSSL